MSDKVEAAYHGSTVSERLRREAPYTEDGPLMIEAADALDARAKVGGDKQWLYNILCENTCAKGIYGVDHDAIASEILVKIKGAW